MAQHAGMVRIYEDAGVTCHYLEPDEVLHRNFFARDSSVMTPWGALICHMQLKCRRADYVSAIRFYQENRIPIWKYATAGHFEGGDFVILEPGKVLVGYCGERSEEAGAEQVATWVREEGWEALVVPISREFVHMDGLVVPLAPKLLVACFGRPRAMARELVAGRKFRIRRRRLCRSEKPWCQPCRPGQRPGVVHEGQPGAERETARIGVRGS